MRRDSIFRVTEHMLKMAMPLGSPMTAADIAKAIGTPPIEASNIAAQIGAFVENGLLHKETRPKGRGAYKYTRLRNAQDEEPSPVADKFEKRLIGGTSITLPKMPILSIDNL